MPYRSSYVSEAKTAVLPSKNPHFYAMKDAMIKNLDTIWSDQKSSQDAIGNLNDALQSSLES
jgi:multiple sugar transport system substrate-binding protein